MRCDVTITPAAGKIEGFDYRLTIFSQGSSQHQSTIYKSLADVEAALTEAGWPEVADKAGKTLELGHEFSHAFELSEESLKRLLRH
jgi:hypothetical protein